MDVRLIKRKTAIDDCIDSSKFEVKQKMQVMLLDDRLGDINFDDQRIGGKPFFATKRSRKPEKASCHACAIMPGRKLFVT